MNPSILGIADGLYPKVLGLGGATSGLTTDQIIAEVLAAVPQPVFGNFLISGGSVIWTTGLSFTVTAASYYINNVRYTSAQQDITLSTADGSNPRIDVIGLDTGGLVFKVTGTAAASPSEPNTDPTTQLQLAFVTIATGATTPTNTGSSAIYIDNAGAAAEWNFTAVGTGFTVGSVSSPINGTKSILVSAPTTASYAQGAIGSGTIDINSYDYLIFKIKNTSSWANNRSLLIEFLSAGVLKGIALQLINGAFGFSSISTATQLIAIPTVLFGIPVGVTVTQIRFIDNGGSINFRLDDIYFRNSGSGAAPQPNALNQDTADARYVRKAQVVNILDTTSFTAAKVAVTETTASGTVTLTATSNMYQFINANGSDRTVQLPAEGLGIAYFIANVGGANTLSVKNDAAGEEVSLAFGECATIVSGASTWVAVKGTIE